MVKTDEKINNGEEGLNEAPLTEEAPITEEAAIATPSRDSFFSNIRNKYPEYENDEDVYKHANESFSRLKDTKNGFEKTVDGLISAMENEPAVAKFVQMLIAHPDNFTYALKTIPREDLEKVLSDWDEPIDDEEASKSLLDYYERRKSTNEFIDNFDKNLESSKGIIAATASEMGVEPEVVSQALVEYVMPIYEGIFSKELISNILKGKDFDKKVEEIAKENYEQGALEGKNAIIEEKKLKKETDGLPMNNSGNINPVEKKKPNSVLAEYKAPNKF